MNSAQPVGTLEDALVLPDRWPRSSPPQVFAERRARLREQLSSPALLASGWPRARNFPHNPYRFRAESHFLYLLGRPLQGAALWLERDVARLYAPEPEPDARLWHGPQPSLSELAAELGLEVRPIGELAAAGAAATLAPQDARAATWLSERLGRAVEAGSTPSHPLDRALADALIELRLRHDAGALGQLRQAAAVTVEAHCAGMRETRAGHREAVVCARMQQVIGAHGMDLSYLPIVTVHGEVLHAEHHDGVLGPSDLLLADVGAETPEGWAADVTRTWPVSGRFSGPQRDLYDAVRCARAAALERVRPGVRYTEVHRASQRALLQCLIDLKILRGSLDALSELHAVALFYPHGVGHLLGLDVHDMEDLGDRAGYAPGRARQPDPSRRYLRLDRDLEPGMLVTIEPGFYQIPELLQAQASEGPLQKALDRERLAQFADVRGIRIEDDVLVTPAGYEVLTAALPTAATEIEEIMNG